MIKEAKRVRWPGKRNDLPDFIKIKGAMLSELFTGLTDGTFSFSILLLFDYRRMSLLFHRVDIVTLMH